MANSRAPRAGSTDDQAGNPERDVAGRSVEGAMTEDLPQGRVVERPRRGSGACHEPANCSRRLSGSRTPDPEDLIELRQGAAGDRESG
jgi:hypothetical protein